MSTTANRVRQVVPSPAVGDLPPGRARRYAIGDVAVAVDAAPEGLAWCEHYLAPFVTSAPLQDDDDPGFTLRAPRDRALWEAVAAVVADLPSRASQTYNGTPIAEWELGDGVLVQQYVARRGFTIVDVARGGIAYLDDGTTDPDWWMEPARLVREVLTRRMEEDDVFVLHAASVALCDQGVAFTGHKRAGKTTLTVAALEHAQAAYIANDRTYVDLRSGTPYVRGWPVTANLGIGTCLGSPTLAALLNDGVISKYPQPPLQSRLDLAEFQRRDVSAMMQERVKVELTPLEMGEAFGVPVSPGRPLNAVVFPQIDPDCAAPELLPVAPGAAAELLMEQVLSCDHEEYPDWLRLRRVSDAETRRRALALVGALVRAIPAYRLRYWDPAAAAPMLCEALARAAA